MATKHEGVHIADRHSELIGDEVAEPRAIKHACHAAHHMMRQTRELTQRPHHRVKRVGDANNERARRVGLNAFADGLHDFQVDADQIVTAHPRFAGHPCGNNDHVSPGDILIIIRSCDFRVVAFNRAALRKIKRLALRNAFNHIKQDDIAKLFLCREMRECTTNITSADQCDFLACHDCSSLEP